MRCRVFVAAFLMIVGLHPTVTAQESEYREVESPYQDDFHYTVNTELTPLVEVDGVRWTRFAVMVKGGKKIVDDKDMAVTVETGFVNTNPSTVKILVIALFEDAAGTPLDRVECAPVSASRDRSKESAQKFKVSGAVLEATRRIYLYCEIVD
jgi:hypothetical protein